MTGGGFWGLGKADAGGAVTMEAAAAPVRVLYGSDAGSGS